MTLVRERRHQEPLTLSIPPLIYHGTAFSVASSSSSSPETSPIQTLNDLEKLSVLGQGSGGTVYKTRHRRTKTLYALKVLRPNLNTTVTVEADILKRIESSFIIKCYAVFVSLYDLCFVMELMEKGSLHDALLAQQVFSEPMVSSLANRILQGLRYLQKMGIVHGDIKPSNLLINKKGEVKIADFGASRIVAGGDYGSNGTCAYMSPERVDLEKWGFGGEVGFAGDVWSLGVVVLECYIGRYPLTKVGDKPDWATLFCAICCNEKVDIPVSCSLEFRDFVGRCLEKDWRKRDTVEELLRHSFVKNR
ncbi:putative mitogen-activated protein kinase kinase 10 STE-STE7 family [Arabidopsis thaliana]|uniref:Mitogen-activated protein kinase kinase 10 n=3 Tax=Arabidopsis TaxID=3701 RepID=M2K10_ARATH|nr:MAP kinase kinase 10 [Arabidopsis thaliana]Q9LQM8.1 RecName: Full=Mitogen-activated protein kinase kinase 10; Short=AtMKK10; Short=MAP kinase kinase 10 [Arabidopsis thaliana]KAG7648245.1 Protein kinase domain [Arabidopsis thaliana x Arabidopsis arenosa]AAF81327.1 Contains similarity to MAP kinase kinase 4 from Arabidopsis thaliana gb/AB015315. It contains a eukaryotic protein kinase domain PF/00069 [Arabidopsis thaliana]AAG60170.1 MAP kinase, putative [Arabidopsis thaliana]ABE65677.1 mitoge|eukprot:NP_174510.1 MAP kinase kinase 10 [Arabidopsis thaliana]